MEFTRLEKSQIKAIAAIHDYYGLLAQQNNFSTKTILLIESERDSTLKDITDAYFKFGG